jgi:hypothetical protein
VRAAICALEYYCARNIQSKPFDAPTRLNVK